MAKSPEDAAAMKVVRAIFARRLIDTSQADLRVTHGILTVRGVIRRMKDGPIELKAEIESIGKVLRQKGIKDVVIDATVRE